MVYIFLKIIIKIKIATVINGYCPDGDVPDGDVPAAPVPASDAANPVPASDAATPAQEVIRPARTVTHVPPQDVIYQEVIGQLVMYQQFLYQMVVYQQVMQLILHILWHDT